MSCYNIIDTMTPLQTILQLFLEMEKGGCMDANNLGTIERIIGQVSPNLKKRISLYQMEKGE